jgi:ribonucleoside-diphosphate reductase beta chain
MARTDYKTTTAGLDRASPAMVLFEKAKRYGTWNPSDLDFTQDKLDWERLSYEERDVLICLSTLFMAGEEAVTRDLLPLIHVVAQEGRLEEEMFLTTFLWEEAKHVDFFHRFLTEVAGTHVNPTGFQSTNYDRIISDALPAALNALRHDASPAAQARASTVYNMIVEGMLAETGYHGYFTILDRHNILPGQRQGISLLKLDESRHIAYGVFLLSRLMAQDPALFEVIQSTMDELLAPGLGVVADIFAQYEVAPFGLQEDEFSQFALTQFQKRLARIHRARTMAIADVDAVTRQIIEDDDA